MVNCSTNGTCILNKTGDNTTDNQLQQSIAQYNIQLISDEEKLFFMCLFITFFVLGVTGNAVVCWVIGKKKQLTGCDTFVISLACADLLSSAFATLQPINYFIWHQRWHLGFELCKILPTVAPISMFASSWSLVLIAADRYRAIVTPMKHRLSTKSKLLFIICIWAVGIIISMPHIFTRGYEKVSGRYLCFEDANAVKQKKLAIYLAIFSVIGWIIPLFTTAIFYVLCVRKLRESRLKNDNSNSMKKRILENKKVIRMFILIGALFCICTLPYSILYATLGFHIIHKIGSSDSEFPLTLPLYLFALSLANSCMNPFIYAKRYPEMKTFAQKLFCKLCCKAVPSNTQTDSMNNM